MRASDMRALDVDRKLVRGKPGPNYMEGGMERKKVAAIIPTPFDFQGYAHGVGVTSLSGPGNRPASS